MPQTVSGTAYFDNAATTAVLPCALERLTELNGQVMGNSSSIHRRGRQAQEVLDQCHEALGRHFNVPPNHVIFTSGGTESNNLAIWGALGGLAKAFQWIKAGGQGKLLASTIEHAATARVFDTLKTIGAPISWIGVNGEGLLKLDQLEQELANRTRLLSIHHVQNEIGVVQDLKAISQLIHAKQPDTLIHLDAVQSFLKLPVDLDALGVDLVSISGHKIGAPKGIGALILGRRFENRNPRLGTLLSGAEQQYGVRPGTVPVPLVGSFITAMQWSEKHFVENSKTLLTLRERLTSQLPPQVIINGPADLSPANPRRAPQTIDFSIPGLPSAVTVEALSARGYCISAGAACHSTNPKPNETLVAMGASRDRALSAVRVSFAPQNTLAEVDGFIEALNEVFRQYL